MSIASDCGACMTGNHEQHDRNHGIREGLIGGTYCDCSGDCDERARARGEELRALWIPLADRAESIGDAEQEPSPSTLWPHGPIVGHPKHDYYVCASCHQPLGPGPCPAKVPTQPDPPTFDSLLSDPTQQLDSEGVVIASIPAPDPTGGAE